MPDLNWRVIEGRPFNSEFFGEYTSGSAPKITGSGTPWVYGVPTYDGAIYFAGSGNSCWGTQDVKLGSKLYFDAERSSIVYWRTDNTVHATALGMYYLIKYI